MRLTRKDLKAGEPLLIGRLRIVLTGGVPTLLLSAWCCHCRRFHDHGWPDLRLDSVHHRRAHCAGHASPFAGSGYWIGADELCQLENEQAIAEFRALTATRPPASSAASATATK